MALFAGSGPPNIEKLAAKKDIRGLIKSLDYRDDPAVRQAAIQALGKLGTEEAIEPLVSLLDDEDTAIRVSVIHALGHIGSSKVIDPLVRGLESRDPHIYTAAAQALGHMDTPKAVEPLIAAIKSKKDDISEVAFESIAQIIAHVQDSSKRDKLIAMFLEALKDSPSRLQQSFVALIDQLGWKPSRDTTGAYYLIARGDWERCVVLGAPAVEPLIGNLTDDNTERRQAAFWALVKIGLPAVEPLIEVLDDEHPAHENAFWALVKIGTPALDPLLATLKQGTPGLREASARALGHIGDQRALKGLFNAVKDEHWAVREAACKALIRFGKPASQALVTALRSPQDDVRWLAARGLQQIGWQPDQSEGSAHYFIAMQDWQHCAALGPVAVPALITAVQHWDEKVRQGATWALIKIGKPSVEPLIEVLQTGEPLSRQAAALALGQIGDPRAAQALNAALSDEYADIRITAIGALLRVGPSAKDMIAALKNEEPQVRKAAAWSLGRSRKVEALQPLMIAAKDEEAEVRLAVVTALGEIGREGALQSLLSMINDPDPQVRAAASEATERISQAQHAG